MRRQYVGRRVRRIYPLYIVVLMANWLGSSLASFRTTAPLSLRQGISQLLLQEGEGAFWTIPVECEFYLLLIGTGWLAATLSGRPLRFLGAISRSAWTISATGSTILAASLARPSAFM